ncbi:hypothetical protein O181_008970 [Austropuccinia psidii MF-1]|uniref:Reverse transcriptase domain-containing protein n=1 Tax=Austropuccinia psidii MF-1 TaxID=1389203 RepID=A0A9Q3GJE8_9BASI|nr:hypothetical protein [Austropuccinia psidii MF-1]
MLTKHTGSPEKRHQKKSVPSGTFADLDDIPTLPLPSTQLQFPQVTEHELQDAINKLPNKKAAGPDKTPNELLKIAKDTITPSLLKIISACLKIHHFPPNGKKIS